VTALAAASPGTLIAETDVKTVVNTLYSNMRGFNYQPSYGSSGFELWQKFRPETINIELTQGKEFFPHMSAIRLWLSWDSYIRNPKLYEERFEIALQCAARHNLVVMPVLFNRWHDYTLDYGGIYLDHILLNPDRRHKLFQPYLESIVGHHAGDDRIFSWDLCNEPMLAMLSASWTPTLRDAEYAWLKDIYSSCKQLGAKAPLCIGPVPIVANSIFVEPLSDIMAIHPYWIPHGGNKTEYEKRLDDFVDLANRVNKPLLATETCWGSLDDQERVDIVEYTLGQLKKRGIGWLAYLLHHSLIADSHRPEYGPLSSPGNLAFIEADGSLRPGHGVFNDF
jgi:hypothetical protein